jgi:large subunit ribosomal protein L4
MANIEIKNKEGKKAGQHTLSEAISGATTSATVLHRTVVAEEANKRQGTQSAKTRSEVRGGGRKPYKQKKTGNARQGTTRAPHYAHGGMAFAVKPRDYEKKVNRKERRAAILSALATQFESGNVTIVEGIVFSEARTKQAITMLKNLQLEGARRVLVVLPAHDEVTYKCFRNLPNVTVRTAPGNDGGKTAVFSARDLMVAQNIVLDKDALAKIEEVWAK